MSAASTRPTAAGSENRLNRLSLAGTSVYAGHLSSLVFGKIKSLWSVNSNSSDAGLNQFAGTDIFHVSSFIVLFCMFCCVTWASVGLVFACSLYYFAWFPSFLFFLYLLIVPCMPVVHHSFFITQQLKELFLPSSLHRQRRSSTHRRREAKRSAARPSWSAAGQRSEWQYKYDHKQQLFAKCQSRADAIRRLCQRFRLSTLRYHEGWYAQFGWQVECALRVHR